MACCRRQPLTTHLSSWIKRLRTRPDLWRRGPKLMPKPRYPRTRVSGSPLEWKSGRASKSPSLADIV